MATEKDRGLSRNRHSFWRHVCFFGLGKTSWLLSNQSNSKTGHRSTHMTRILPSMRIEKTLSKWTSRLSSQKRSRALFEQLAMGKSWLPWATHSERFIVSMSARCARIFFQVFLFALFHEKGPSKSMRRKRKEGLPSRDGTTATAGRRMFPLTGAPADGCRNSCLISAPKVGLCFGTRVQRRVVRSNSIMRNLNPRNLI